MNHHFKIVIFIYYFFICGCKLCYTQDAATEKNSHDAGVNMFNPSSQEMEVQFAGKILQLRNFSYFGILEEDIYSILATGNHSCMNISDEKFIPIEARGTRNYGQECDPSPTGVNKCIRYVKVEPTAPHTHSTCFKPTNLICDPATKRCMCAKENMLISPIRFQFGSTDGGGKKTMKNGRCLIRPTFDIVPGFDCSPGTVPKTVVLEDDEEPVHFCGCENDNEMDKFNTNDPDWWACGKGPPQLRLNILAWGLSFIVVTIRNPLL